MKQKPYKDVGNWRTDVWLNDDGSASPQQVQLAVLFVIRDQLIEINRKLSALECPRFTRIPTMLDRIEQNTQRPKRKRKTARA